MLDRRQEEKGTAGRPRPATYADIEATPEHLVAEIIDGMLVTHPRPAPRHAVTSHALAAELGQPLQKGRGGPGGWVFFNEPEIKFGDNILVPDTAAWRRESFPGYPETNRIETPPDWLWEVLSASTEKRGRTVKLRIYAEAGIPHLWLIDPRLQLPEAYELRGGSWTLLSAWNGDQTASVPPFDAITVALADLWPLDRPLGFAENPQALTAGDR